MDTAHPAIRAALEEEPGYREAESPLMPQLRIRAMDVNELCLPLRKNLNRIGLILSRAMLDIEDLVLTGRITKAEREQLKRILGDGLEEPRDDLAYIIQFPGREEVDEPDRWPPPAA